MARPIIALVGGFLGAGKTTLLLQVAHRLAAQGRRVGIIAAVAKPVQLRKVSDRLQALWPRARVLVLSALTGTGVDRWMAHLGSDEPGGEAILDLDYETYAQAEVAPGWMNARVSTEPATLERCAHEALNTASLRHAVAVRLDEVRSFRPSPPRPTHRLSQPG